MKKKLLLLPVIMALLLTITSCSFVKNLFHNHEYGDYVVITKASCETDGIKKRTCTSCGYEDMVVEKATGHEFDLIKITKEATCEEDGVKSSTCKKCNKVVSQKLPATGHDLGDKIHVAATCLLPGSDTGICKNCKKVVVETIPATGHTPNENTWVIESAGDCSHKGVESTTCTVCHLKVSREIGLGTHAYVDTNVKTATGHTITKHTCSACDDFYYDSLVVDYTKNYGYQTLASFANGNKYQTMYTSLYDQLQTFSISTKNLDFSVEKGNIIASYEYAAVGLTENEAAAVYSVLYDENPQFYFLSSGFGQTYKINGFGNEVPETYTIHLYCNENFAKYNDRKNYSNELNAILKEMTANYNMAITPAEKAKYIHDTMCNRIDYAYQSNGSPESAYWAHNMVGYVLNKKGVCECYSKSYLYFSNFFGVESTISSGEGVTTKGKEGHSWNLTKIDGSWYGVDVTWDDQKTIYYNYFLKGFNDGFTASHITRLCDFSNVVTKVNGSSVISFQITTPTIATQGYVIG